MRPSCQHEWKPRVVAHFVHHRCERCGSYRGDVTPEHTVWELYDKIEALEKELADVRTLDRADPNWRNGRTLVGMSLCLVLGQAFSAVTPAEARSKAAAWIREQQESSK